MATAYAVALGLVGWTSARGLLLNVSPVRASSVLLIVLVSFSVSVGEETFYRGWLLVHWNASTTKFLAGAASLLLFVIAHFGGDWFVIVRALILGAVMTWVTQEKNNLLPAVLLHTVANVGFVSHDLAASGALMPLSLGR